jgi:hypothetical protein
MQLVLVFSQTLEVLNWFSNFNVVTLGRTGKVQSIFKLVPRSEELVRIYSNDLMSNMFLHKIKALGLTSH